MKTSVHVQQLLLTGLSNKEIAHKACISEYAVKYHMTKLLKAHSCKSRTELIIALQKKKPEILNDQVEANQVKHSESFSKD